MSAALRRRRSFSVSLVCVTGPGLGSRQRTGPGLRAGGARAVESKLRGCVGKRARARRRPECASPVVGASVQPSVVVLLVMGRRRCPSRSWLSISRNKAGFGLVTSCRLFAISRHGADSGCGQTTRCRHPRRPRPRHRREREGPGSPRCCDAAIGANR
jgi:hypothetical protein